VTVCLRRNLRVVGVGRIVGIQSFSSDVIEVVATFIYATYVDKLTGRRGDWC
jgi:hypothetical protein